MHVRRRTWSCGNYGACLSAGRPLELVEQARPQLVLLDAVRSDA
jgi:hypothetical protein